MAIPGAIDWVAFIKLFWGEYADEHGAVAVAILDMDDDEAIAWVDAKNRIASPGRPTNAAAVAEYRMAAMQAKREGAEPPPEVLPIFGEPDPDDVAIVAAVRAKNVGPRRVPTHADMVSGYD